MDGLLSFDWYYSEPYDFEHKQWILFDYLKKIDDAFCVKKFSPYLLHTEGLTDNMRMTLEYIRSFEKGITKQSLLFSTEGIYLVKQPPKRPDDFVVIIDVMEFSIPLLQQRIDLGNKLIKRFPPGLLY